MKKLINVLKLPMAVICGFFAMAIIPIYDMPFAGCANDSSLFEYPGCTLWPQLARGMSFSVPFHVIFFKQRIYWIIPILILFLVACLGGFTLLNTGLFSNINNSPDIFYNVLANWLLIAGSIIVSTIVFCIIQFKRLRYS